MHGMEIYCMLHTFFYPTQQTKRTTALARKVAQEILLWANIQETPTPETIQFVKNNMQPANLEYSKLSNGSEWLCIKTEYSCHNAPADDLGTVILKGE